MTFLHKYLTRFGHPGFPFSRRSGPQIFDNWLMPKEMQQPSDRPVYTDGLNALIQRDHGQAGDGSGTVKCPGGSQLPLRRQVGRSQLFAGVLLAIGASILAGCSSNAAGTTGHAIPADNGGNAAGAGSVLGTSSPALHPICDRQGHPADHREGDSNCDRQARDFNDHRPEGYEWRWDR